RPRQDGGLHPRLLRQRGLPGGHPRLPRQAPPPLRGALSPQAPVDAAPRGRQSPRMAKVRFEPAGYEAEAHPGDRFVDITDEHPKADVPYSCRSASCGTCRVEVVKGLEAMAEAEDDKLEVLYQFGDEPRVRLACQLKLERETDRVVLRVLEPLF